MKEFKTFALVSNEKKDNNLTAAADITAELIRLGADVVMEKHFEGRIENVRYYTRGEMLDCADIVVIIGGDGTILDIAPYAAEKNVPVVGINYGNLGFLSQAERDDKHIFKDILNGKYETDSRIMIDAEVINGNSGEVVKKFTALNDVVVFRGEYSRMIKLNLEIDGYLAESYPADGIIIATPTGSTAYSLSAGGPIVDPQAPVLIVTPICPHTIRGRSMVVQQERKIAVKVVIKTKMDAVISVDGNEGHIMNEGEYVEIVKSKNTINLIRLSDKNFFEILRKKML